MKRLFILCGFFALNLGCETQFTPMAEFSLPATKDLGGGIRASCIPGQPHISQKKTRRLTADQLKKLVYKVHSQTWSQFRTLDFVALEAPISDRGFTGESEKAVVEESAMERWIASLEKVPLNLYDANYKIYFQTAPKSCWDNGFTEGNCIEEEFKKYALPLWRRPPTTEEIANVKAAVKKIKAEGASFPLQLAFIHKYILINPSFFYRTELGLLSPNQKQSLVDLDNYEIASFLSYSLIDDAPDDLLYEKAQKGLLKDLRVVEDEINRLAVMPAAKENIKNILMDFLKLNKVASIAGDKFSKYTYDGSFSVPGSVQSSLAIRLHDQAFRVHHTVLNGEAQEFIKLRLGEDLNYMNIFSGNTYPTSNRSIAIYGVRDKVTLDKLFVSADPTKDNNSALYTANANERHGILSHPAYLSVHSKENDTGMVHRGVFFLEQLLCHTMPGSPANVFPVNELPPGYDPTVLTSRKKFEILHSQQGACFGCHQPIDNIGGSFENFDQTGYFRKKEMFQYQNKWYTLDIDSSGKLQGVGDINISYSNTIDFIKKVTEAPHFKKCVNRRVLEYLVGELNNSVNSCDYEVKARNLASEKNPAFKDLLLTTVRDPNFFKRRTEGGE